MRAALLCGAAGALVLCTAGGAAAQGVQVSPASEGDLEAVLRKLAAMGRREGWCSSDCATLLEVRLSGKLADGELRVQVRGAVTSEQRAYVELFGARPDAGLDQLLGAGRPVPLYWSGAAYSAGTGRV